MLKQRLLTAVKFIIPVGILAYLIVSLATEPPPSPGQPTTLERLADQQKNWWALAAGFGLAMAAFCITAVRWHLLVRVMGIEFKLREAFRLTFLGFLFNFVLLGAVGGDLLKAFLIAHERPGQRTEAAASVAVDRLVGFFALLLMASLGVCLAEVPPAIKPLTSVVLAATAAGALGIVVVLVPRVTTDTAMHFLARIPRVGPHLERLVEAVRMYRRRWPVLVVSGAMSLAVHGLFAASVFVAGGAIFAATPTLADHLIISPLATVAGSLPIAPGGIGTYELAIKLLYPWFNPVKDIPGQGTVVALVFRAYTILIAMVGVVYYFGSRGEVKEVIHEAEQELDHPLPDGHRGDR